MVIPFSVFRDIITQEICIWAIGYYMLYIIAGSSTHFNKAEMK